MDYVVGSVAALISGNVTPNRPRLVRRALTPTKHQPSPNVTPKSEFVEDRSIFLSPTMQKKKAIVKKSPKRIFQNPDLDATNDEEGNSSAISPKGDKVKKHLKEDLESSGMPTKVVVSSKSPKKKLNKSSEDVSLAENPKVDSLLEDMRQSNENTPKKKKKKNFSIIEGDENVKPDLPQDTNTEEISSPGNTPNKVKRIKKKKINNTNNVQVAEQGSTETEIQSSTNQLQKSPKKNNKVNKEQEKIVSMEVDTTETTTNKKTNNKKKKKNKKNKTATTEGNQTEKVEELTQSNENKKHNKKKGNKKQAGSKSIVNPNAITAEDSDSEHDSDDEIESENEELNKELLETPAVEESSDEEEPAPSEPKEKKEKEQVVQTEEEVKRTLFVGNVPFSSKCKKELKKIFNKHGQIETIRIRTVPVKDARVTPKLAVIKEELHPERSTVNVYIKYKDPDSVHKALVENNTVLNEHHLRVSRSDTTGSEHDPHCSVFVGNLPFALEDETFRATFEKCGEIESVRIIRDRKTNAGKGFGYINFATKDGVELALALTEEDLTIKNRILRVKRCTLTQGNQKNQRGGGNNRRFDNSRSHGDNSSGFNSHRGGSNHRGGFVQRGGSNFRGGFVQRGGSNHRGGFSTRGGSNHRGGFNQRGGNSQRGGFNRGGMNKFGQNNGDRNENEGAFRRIMNKRPNPDGGDGPPNKRQNLTQPKEKKTRKEFVGMTAEKKKKNKFDKGQKKKKQLSEILTK